MVFFLLLLVPHHILVFIVQHPCHGISPTSEVSEVAPPKRLEEVPGVPLNAL